MCGRFAQTSSPETLITLFKLVSGAACEPRYNLAPTQPIVALRPTPAGRIAQHMRWGLVPSWADDLSRGAKLINARSETVFDKRSFAESARHRRCIIPADGFYEWIASKHGRLPTLFRPTQGPIMCLAGLWSTWAAEDGEVIYTATILTTAANATLQPFHHRMPVLLTGDSVDTWLDSSVTDTNILMPLLKPAPEDAISLHPVSTRVNSVRNDDRHCWDPATDPLN